MRQQSRHVVLTALLVTVVAGVACTQKATDQVGEKVADAARKAAERTADETKAIAGKIAAATGEAISDTWISTKVSAKFADEAVLHGSTIDVDTDNHVVTLKGTVASTAAKERAETIAGGTEGVTRVLNQLVVT